MEVKVTRKGQVTIPVELRKKYGIVEGVKLIIEDSPEGILIKVIPRIEDLAGVDAGKLSLEEALQTIDEMRREDRY